MTKTKALLAVAVASAVSFGDAMVVYDLPPKTEVITDEIVGSQGEVMQEQIAAPIMTDEELSEEIFYDSLEYLAQCVEAEAGNQSLDGKIAVACVIFNRVESSRFPNDVESVINDKNQFEVVANGSINRVPSEDAYKAVTIAFQRRPYPSVYFFTAGRYNPGGTPAFKLGDHYVSTL